MNKDLKDTLTVYLQALADLRDAEQWVKEMEKKLRNELK